MEMSALPPNPPYQPGLPSLSQPPSGSPWEDGRPVCTAWCSIGSPGNDTFLMPIDRRARTGSFRGTGALGSAVPYGKLLCMACL